jgi:hypothetical protein
MVKLCVYDVQKLCPGLLMLLFLVLSLRKIKIPKPFVILLNPASCVNDISDWDKQMAKCDISKYQCSIYKMHAPYGNFNMTLEKTSPRD